jgi:hypothetical protein
MSAWRFSSPIRAVVVRAAPYVASQRQIGPQR